MIEWRRVLSLVVRPHSVASNWPTGIEGNVRAAAGGERTSARPWTISTEFLVESEPDESTRNGGA